MTSPPADAAVPVRPLLRAALARPGLLPELLAGFAVRHMGPPAARSVAALREGQPGATPAELRTKVVSSGTRRTVAQGAFVGGPFLVFIPVAFCLALLSQARMMLELAALDGRDATDMERAAELLVLQGVYADEDRARAALADLPTEDGRPPGSRTRALWDLVLRMARLLGLITPARSGTWVRIRQWALLVLVVATGMVAPLVWLPYMAHSYRRSTKLVTDRAVPYYFGTGPQPPARRRGLDPAAVAGALRAVVSLLVPIALTVVTLATGSRLAGSQWPVLALVLFAGSVATGGLWYAHHRRARAAGDGP
ncbi:hypothetical protein AB0M28_12055 [Streptomyces sp. NPDC051940]|uniref:hypothetical protein n=1 Tax=Streptomyces sp. NPDC051940 TaxID=3155675 RepID=UPI00341A0DDD